MNSIENFFKIYDYEKSGEIFQEIVNILGENLNKWNNNSIFKYNNLKKNENIFLRKTNERFYIYNKDETFHIYIDFLKEIIIYKNDGGFLRIWSCNSLIDNYIIRNYEKELYIKKDNKYKLIDINETLNNNIYYERENYNNFNIIQKLNKDDYQFNINNDYFKYNFPNGFKAIKYKIDINIPYDFKNKVMTFFHNKKIGVTYKIINRLIDERIHYGIRTLYLNIGFLENNNLLNIWKDYFYYYASMLFKKNELNSKDNYENFSNNIFRIINRGFNLENILNYILSYFKYGNIKIVFDNIYNKDIYNRIIKMKLGDNSYNCYLNYIISLNENTYEILNDCIKNNINFYFLQKNNIENQKLEDDLENIYDEETYRNIKTKEINDIINKKGPFFIFSSLIILINIIYKEQINSEKEDIDILTYIYPFINYIYFQIDENKKITKIKYRNNIIKEMIYDIFIFSQYFHLLSAASIQIDNISKKEEGNNLEKLIVYSLLINKYKSEYFYKIKVKSIYCISDIPNIDYNNQNILFFEENPYSEKYDFAILIYKNGELILKAFQIGINKKGDDLIKLKNSIIFLDLSTFSYKLEKIINRKIDKISFGIITTKKALNDNKNYPNFTSMKKFCKKEGYEFILFDTSNCELFIEDKNYKNNYIRINNFSNIYEYNFKKSVFIKDGNPIKIPTNKIKKEKVIENINNILIEKKIIEKNLNLLLVGMFLGNASNFIVNDYICYHHKELNKLHNITIYYKNIEVSKIFNIENLTPDNHILFFKIIKENEHNFIDNIKYESCEIKNESTKNKIYKKFKKNNFSEDNRIINKKIDKYYINDNKMDINDNEINNKNNHNSSKNIFLSSDEENYNSINKNSDLFNSRDEKNYSNISGKKKKINENSELFISSDEEIYNNNYGKKSQIKEK